MSAADRIEDALAPHETLASPGLRRGWIVAGLLMAAGGAALYVDLPIARWAHERHYPDELYRVCALTEVFAHGLGVPMIALAIYVLDPKRRRLLAVVLYASLGSGLITNLFKLLLARQRPYTANVNGRVIDTFSGWFPLLRVDSDLQGFPSSHAATAVGLALALAWLYPNGRKLFFGLAILASCQRVLKDAHFVSDVCWGAAVGYGHSTLVLFCAARLFNRRWVLSGGRSATNYAPAVPRLAAWRSIARPFRMGGRRAVAAGEGQLAPQRRAA